MSIFRRKKKPLPTRDEVLKLYELNPESLPKTNPGFKSATALINITLRKLDAQNEEKRTIQKAAKKISQRVQDMNLHWRMPKKA